MAIRFEKAFGVSAATMLRMQSAYDLAQAKGGSERISIERVREPA
jgi:plasmid maintenance system antidote protein VapI